jgi:hypothetical protein
MASLAKLSPGEVDALPLAFPSGATSWVWKHALLSAPGVVCCIYCGHRANYVNASNMATHLKDLHKLRDTTTLDAKRQRPSADQPTLEAVVATSSLSPTRKDQLNKAVVAFVIAVGAPLHMITGDAFRRLLSVRAHCFFQLSTATPPFFALS